MVVIGVVACLFDLLMRWIEHRLVPWKTVEGAHAGKLAALQLCDHKRQRNTRA